jgi:hypothetical protein
MCFHSETRINKDKELAFDVMTPKKHQNLHSLLANYLHQDWAHEFTTPDGAIRAFKKEPAQIIHAACQELGGADKGSGVV